MHFHSAPDGFLVAAKLVGPTAMASTRSEEEFTVRLKNWVPDKNLFTNGFILEIIHKFGLKEGSEISGALFDKVVQLVGPDVKVPADRDTRKKIHKAFMRTQNTKKPQEETWYCLDRIAEEITTKWELKLSKLLDTLHKPHACGNCSETGDNFAACPGCLQVFYIVQGGARGRTGRKSTGQTVSKRQGRFLEI